MNTPIGYRVLLVDADEHGLAPELMAAKRADLVVETVRTTADAVRKIGEAQYAAVIAVHGAPEVDGLDLLTRVAAAGPDTLRFLISRPGAALTDDQTDSCFHLAGAAATGQNVATFITEGLKLHRVAREHKELVKKLGGEFERLRKREKLLDTVVRERTKELETAYLKLKAANRQALLGLAEAIEAKDPYTKGHCGRVAAYAMALARECHYPEHDMESLEFAAFLHDIGKIGVRDAVLLKPGPLDEEEWKHMKIHPEVGFEIASKIDMLKPTMAAIRNHHERWDGKGYPDGIAAEDIPLSARVVCVADCFDAMATDRPYKRALTLEECLANLQKSRGVQFDPQLVDLFVERRIGELFMY
ncbi:MAG TPA: HD domain-containing phosphohydrolase [Polyangia bacterium]